MDFQTSSDGTMTKFTYLFKAIPGVTFNQTKEGSVSIRFTERNIEALQARLNQARLDIRAYANQVAAQPEPEVAPAPIVVEPVKKIVRVGMSLEQARQFAIDQRRERSAPKEAAPPVTVEAGIEPDDGSLGEPPVSLKTHGLENGPGAFNV